MCLVVHMQPTPRLQVITRSTVELAVVLSLSFVTVALALTWFLHVPAQALVIGAIVLASLAGFRQPAARLAPVAATRPSVHA